MVSIRSRSSWGARAPRSVTRTTWAARRGFTVHYSAGPTSQTPRQIQNFHMDGNGWSDVGYNFLVDSGGTAYEGRGWLTVGAHASPYNTSHIGVCFIGRDGDATDAAKATIRALYDEACKRAGRTLSRTGHRDLNSTSCPGNDLYAWVRDGMPTDHSSDGEDDDVSVYVSIDKTSKSRTETVTSGEWTQVYLDHQNSAGAASHHGDGDWPSIVTGPADYWGRVAVRLSGLPAGVEGQARLIEVDAAKGADGEHRVREREYPTEFVGSGGDTFVVIPVCGYVNDGRKLRIEITHFGPDDVRPTVAGAQVRLRVATR